MGLRGLLISSPPEGPHHTMLCRGSHSCASFWVRPSSRMAVACVDIPSASERQRNSVMSCNSGCGCCGLFAKGNVLHCLVRVAQFTHGMIGVLDHAVGGILEKI